MYFQNFPTIYYEYEIDGQRIIKLVKDITINVRVQKQLLENIALYDEYDIKDGETPEIISSKVYGTSLYHWVIMMVNQRYDLVNDFPLATEALYQYTNNKYENMNAVHHWEIDDGYIVSFDTERPAEYPNATSVTNYEYEEAENEKKRRIKLVSPEYIGDIMSQLRGLM